MSDQNNNLKPCSAIILAAGYSSRMKSHKFALQFDKNYVFLEKIIQVYAEFGCKEIIVVLNQEGKKLLNSLNLELKNTTIVLNTHPEWERFYSIKVGLQSLTQEQAIFIHNVDNPFVNIETLESLFKQNNTADYIIPTYKARGGHPILISNKVCRALISEKNNDAVFSDFLKKYEQKRVVVDDEQILVNINTEKVYRAFFG